MYPCRVVRAISEFHRVLKQDGQVVISDECPLPKATITEEKVAALRWQLLKALSDLLGERHYNEIEPEDLESIVKLVGFKHTKWATFKGREITEQRINHFENSANRLASQLDDTGLKRAFSEKIKATKNMFRKEGGVFAPRYILHARK